MAEVLREIFDARKMFTGFLSIFRAVCVREWRQIAVPGEVCSCAACTTTFGYQGFANITPVFSEKTRLKRPGRNSNYTGHRLDKLVSLFFFPFF